MHPRTRDALFLANLALFVLLIGHTLDHAVNQPSRHLPAALDYIGAIGFIASAISLLLALRGSPTAPVAAVVVGTATVLSFLAIHLVPHWSALSDSYWDLNPNAISWILVLAPTAAAAILAAVGARRLESRARLA